MTLDTDLFISASEYVKEEDLRPALEALGPSFAIERREETPQASLQWLMTTAIAIYVVKPYTDKILGKLAEDNYETLKSALAKLWTLCISTSRELRVGVMQSGKYKYLESEIGLELSFLALTKRGHRVRLLFKRGMPEDDFARSVAELYALIENDDLIHAIAEREGRTIGKWSSQFVLVWSREEHSLVEIDVIGSSMQRTLLTKSLQREGDEG